MPSHSIHDPVVSRRQFLRDSSLALAGASLAAGCATRPFHARQQLIDCHTHFYDPTRPQGVPWPGKSDTKLYRPVYPRDYMALAKQHGVTGTVVVEASAWIDDNQWILDLAATEPFIVGLVGRLNHGTDEFPSQLKRFAANRLFRGIRISGGDVMRLNEAAMLRDLKLLADADLTLDVNGGVSSLAEVARAAAAVPALRIVIDHVANVRIDGKAPPRDWLDGMKAAAGRPNVFCKVSGLVEGSGRRDQAPSSVEFYRPVLDAVWDCFGEHRVVYGSNWPVCEMFASFATVHELVRQYFESKGERAARRYFNDNTRAAYKWIERKADQ